MYVTNTVVCKVQRYCGESERINITKEIKIKREQLNVLSDRLHACNYGTIEFAQFFVADRQPTNQP